MMAIEIDLDSALLPLNNGKTVSLGGGSTMTFRVSSEDTGGAYSVLEYVAAPGAGSTMHVHRNEDESFFILEGALTFQLGDNKTRATPGTFIQIPKGLRHAFVNAEPEPARSLVILTPAGLEYFFAEISELLSTYPSGPPAEVVRALTEKYGLDFGPFEPAGS
jgi:quercetin dioxygenase-like cupin family protein